MTKALAKKAPPPAHSHADALAFLQQAIAVLDELISANPTDIEGLVRAEQLLDRMGKDVRALRTEAIRLAVQAMGKNKKLEVAGLGTVELAFGKPKRTYDEDAVDTFLVAVAAKAEAKAEKNGDNVGRAIVRAVRSVLYKADPKDTALKAYGVDPDDMSTKEWGDPKIKVTATPEAIPTPLKSVTTGGKKK